MISKYYYQNGKEVKVVRELGKGGEGIAYLTETQEVLKIYKPENLTQDKRQKVEAITRKNLQFEGICLPTQIVLNERNQFTGYIMPKAEGFEMKNCIFNPQLLKQKLK
jgi:DNA-binding helix-hairpin-helix protein with protein kinase domain